MSVKRPVYLDYAAATPSDQRVIEEMISCMSIDGAFANPHAKDHVYGWEAAEAVETARDRVAALIGASPLEIYFTSGATEANNLAIFGLAEALEAQGSQKKRLVTSPIEHKAVLEACEKLSDQGFEITYIKPDCEGIVTAEMLKDVMDDDVFLVTLAQANSVLGSVNDVHKLAKVARSFGAFFHTDTAQSAGYVKTDFDSSDVSMATLTSEKICGPKGVGALYVQRAQKVPLEAQILGGGQEKGLRGGTVPTHQVAGMGKAFEIMRHQGNEDAKRMNALRDKLIKGLSAVEGCVINGSSEHHVPGILSVSFKGIDGSKLMPTLSGVACSTGSACSSADLKPSYILTGIGLDDALARASLRLSWGRFTKEQEIDEAVSAIAKAVKALRA